MKEALFILRELESMGGRVVVNVDATLILFPKKAKLSPNMIKWFGEYIGELREMVIESN